MSDDALISQLHTATRELSAISPSGWVKTLVVLDHAGHGADDRDVRDALKAAEARSLIECALWQEETGLPVELRVD